MLEKPHPTPASRRRRRGRVRTHPSSSPLDAAIRAIQCGDAHMRREQPRAAVRYFTLAVDVLEAETALSVPDVAQAVVLRDACHRLARALVSVGRIRAAVRPLQRAHGLDPDDLEIARTLAALHMRCGELLAARGVESGYLARLDDEFDLAVELLRAGDQWWACAAARDVAIRRYRAAVLYAADHPELAKLVEARLRAVTTLALVA